MNTIDIPDNVTTCCPLESFRSRSLVEACVKCDFFAGVNVMCPTNEIEKKDPVSGAVIGVRPIMWHEKYMLVCKAPMTRRCHAVETVES